MFTQPSAQSSAIVSGLLFLLTLSSLRVWSDFFSSTEQLTILGGFISSLLFFFGLMTLGNLERETKWIEVMLCLFIALGFAATVHRVCVTTCFLFSVVILFYMYKMSQRINEKAVAANMKPKEPSKKKKKRS
eukprot:TRINITY_DN4161_c0_g1_i1.p1 TRINITY_DN4161_c0_g1~~TRINITY_DN4161_c0_g1_i1.p1  ORF type:complete len:132 (+),score=17.15 TRINITY_DN4161_c0_g1_i1:58-453(+)